MREAAAPGVTATGEAQGGRGVGGSLLTQHSSRAGGTCRVPRCSSSPARPRPSRRDSVLGRAGACPFLPLVTGFATKQP